MALFTYYIRAFQSYADFSGRATRSEYWLFQVLNAVINYGLLFIAWRNDWSMGVLVVLILYSLVSGDPPPGARHQEAPRHRPVRIVAPAIPALHLRLDCPDVHVCGQKRLRQQVRPRAGVRHVDVIESCRCVADVPRGSSSTHYRI